MFFSSLRSLVQRVSRQVKRSRRPAQTSRGMGARRWLEMLEDRTLSSTVN